MTEFPVNRTVLAVDIGGTKIAAAGVTGSRQIVARRREATPVTGPTDLMPRLTAMLADLQLEAGSPVAVGIGLPAMLEPNSDRVLWAPNIPGCRDVLLREPLEQALRVPVFLEYDGHTAVLGEWWQGAGRGYQNVVFSIIGTGIGGGMIVNGTLYRGRNRLAGAAGCLRFRPRSTTLTRPAPAASGNCWRPDPGSCAAPSSALPLAGRRNLPATFSRPKQCSQRLAAGMRLPERSSPKRCVSSASVSRRSAA